MRKPGRSTRKRERYWKRAGGRRGADGEWESYEDVKLGFEIKYPKDWILQEEGGVYKKYSIGKNDCHIDIFGISPEEYLQAIKYTDGKKANGCNLLYWWQADSGGFTEPRFEKINCNSKLNSLYYGGYYFQNGGNFFRVLVWNEKSNLFNPVDSPETSSSDCGSYFKPISATFVLYKK